MILNELLGANGNEIRLYPVSKYRHNAEIVAGAPLSFWQASLRARGAREILLGYSKRVVTDGDYGTHQMDEHGDLMFGGLDYESPAPEHPPEVVLNPHNKNVPLHWHAADKFIVLLNPAEAKARDAAVAQALAMQRGGGITGVGGRGDDGGASLDYSDGHAPRSGASGVQRSPPPTIAVHRDSTRPIAAAPGVAAAAAAGAATSSATGDESSEALRNASAAAVASSGPVHARTAGAAAAPGPRIGGSALTAPSSSATSGSATPNAKQQGSSRRLRNRPGLHINVDDAAAPGLSSGVGTGAQRTPQLEGHAPRSQVPAAARGGASVPAAASGPPAVAQLSGADHTGTHVTTDSQVKGSSGHGVPASVSTGGVATDGEGHSATSSVGTGGGSGTATRSSGGMSPDSSARVAAFGTGVGTPGRSGDFEHPRRTALLARPHSGPNLTAGMDAGGVGDSDVAVAATSDDVVRGRSNSEGRAVSPPRRFDFKAALADLDGDAATVTLVSGRGGHGSGALAGGVLPESRNPIMSGVATPRAGLGHSRDTGVSPLQAAMAAARGEAATGALGAHGTAVGGFGGGGATGAGRRPMMLGQMGRSKSQRNRAGRTAGIGGGMGVSMGNIPLSPRNGGIASAGPGGATAGGSAAGMSEFGKSGAGLPDASKRTQRMQRRRFFFEAEAAATAEAEAAEAAAASGVTPPQAKEAGGSGGVDA